MSDFKIRPVALVAQRGSRLMTLIAAGFCTGISQASPVEIDPFTYPSTAHTALVNSSNTVSFTDHDSSILGGTRCTDYQQYLHTPPASNTAGAIAVGAGVLAVTAGVGAYADTFAKYGSWCNSNNPLGLDLSSHHRIQASFTRIKATKNVNLILELYTSVPLYPDSNALYYVTVEKNVPAGGPGQPVTVTLDFRDDSNSALFNFGHVDGVLMETDVAAQVQGDGYVLTDLSFIDD